MTTVELIAALQEIIIQTPEAADMTVRLQTFSGDTTDVEPQVYRGEVWL